MKHNALEYFQSVTRYIKNQINYDRFYAKIARKMINSKQFSNKNLDDKYF